MMVKLEKCLFGMLVFCSMLFVLPNVVAQTTTKAISGVVVDTNGDPLIGVSVLVKGTTSGSITDVNGKFSVPAVSVKNPSLVFTYIGYDAQEVSFKGQMLRIQLVENTKNLEEVVVVGYGVQKKKDKTGAVTNIEAKDFVQGVLQDPIQAIQGKVPGVAITKKGGDPNAGFDVRIRGTAGLSSGTGPLYVIDGVPGIDPTTVAVEDIESFNVLKDASSAAIYGSRGATGVILITTKKGKSGDKGQVSYSGYYSADYVAKRMDILSASEIRNYAAEKNIVFSDDQGNNTNWQDVIFRTGQTQSHNIAISYGNDTHTLRASVNYDKFDGVVRGTSKERSIMHINGTQKGMKNHLTLSMNLSSTFEKNNYVNTSGSGDNGTLFQAYTFNPIYPVYNQNGSYFEKSDFEYSNPLALINQITDKRDAKRLLANFRADLDIFKGLQAGVNISYRRADAEKSFERPSYQKTTTDGGYAKRSYENSATKMLETTLKYDKTIGNHNINLLGGYSWQEDAGDSFSAQGRDLISDIVGADNLKWANDVLPQDIESFRDRSRLISFMGRGVYNYKSKYYLTGTIRRDGSSRFGDNKEWGWFPSFSTAWDISQESFMKHFDWLGQLKVRLGYGVTGNQEIGNYNDIARMSIGGRTLDPTTLNKTLIVQQASNANPNLQWEQNSEWNLGLDFAVLNSRLTGSIELYNKNTNNLIASYEVPVPPNRYSSILANAGVINNKGIEITLSGIIVNNKNFNWKSDFAFSKNKQNVVSLSNDNFNLSELHVSNVGGRGMVGVWSQIVKPGYELGTFYGWKCAGISQEGLWLFYDKSGNITKQQVDADRQVIGHAMPDFILNWSNTFTLFKNWDVSFNLRSVVGNDVLNSTRMIMGNPNMLPNRNALRSAIALGTILKDAPKFSDYYIEDGSFIRMDNLTLGYNFKFKEKSWLTSARVYISSNNVFTLTKYSGIDPETNYGGYEKTGIDAFDIYPKTRTLTMGFKVIF